MAVAPAQNTSLWRWVDRSLYALAAKTPSIKKMADSIIMPYNWCGERSATVMPHIYHKDR